MPTGINFYVLQYINRRINLHFKRNHYSSVLYEKYTQSKVLFNEKFAFSVCAWHYFIIRCETQWVWLHGFEIGLVGSHKKNIYIFIENLHIKYEINMHILLYVLNMNFIHVNCTYTKSWNIFCSIELPLEEKPWWKQQVMQVGLQPRSALFR